MGTSRLGTTEAVEATPSQPRADRGDELPKAFPPPLAAALVFVAAGAVLMLEILSVRLLAPYVGLTLETTTAIIGAALAGIAIGAAVGGYFADRTDTRRLVVMLLLVGGLLTLLVVPSVRWLGPGARGQGNLAALGVTVVALVPAAAVLSAVSPSVAHLQLHDLRASGTIVGRLSAWATAGALLGTFGTGFVIVPLLPISTAVLLIGAVLLVVGVALGAGSPLLSPGTALGVALVALAFGALSVTSSSPCMSETKYHCLSVEAVPGEASSYELKLDDAYNSFVDLRDPTHLKYRYTRWIADAIDGAYPPGKPLDAVFVGGGAFTLPRWLDATRPGSSAEVLEVDGGVVSFDRERLGLRTTPDLRAVVGDARMTMRDVPSNSADVVVGDAYSGYTIPWHLTTTEWLEEVDRVLKPGGIYALNLIDEGPLDFLKAEASTLLGTFADVRLIGVVFEGNVLAGGNVVLVASDRPMASSVRSSADRAYTYLKPEVERVAAGAEALTDDYAPVDQLRTIEPEQ